MSQSYCQLAAAFTSLPQAALPNRGLCAPVLGCAVMLHMQSMLHSAEVYGLIAYCSVSC